MLRGKFVAVSTYIKKKQRSWAPVVHACNLNYSGGRDQEDRSSKPDQENSSQDPILKKIPHKKSWWSGPKLKPWYCQNKKTQRPLK
jgi:hypothetical protein